MINFLIQQIGLTIHQSNISRLLKRKGITYKKLTYNYSEQNEEKVQEFIKSTKPLLQTHPFLAMDECSFHLKEDPRYGYSLKGSRAISRRPSSQGKHYTLLLCIKNSNQSGVTYYELIEKGAKVKEFHDFLENINLPSEEKHYLLLDNAKIHYAPYKRKELELPSVKEQLAKKNIEAKYIVAYSPQLNPVELCFNFLRQQIEKHRPRNLEELKNYVDKTVETLNQKDLSKYFKHCFEYFDR